MKVDSLSLSSSFCPLFVSHHRFSLCPLTPPQHTLHTQPLQFASPPTAGLVVVFSPRNLPLHVRFAEIVRKIVSAISPDALLKQGACVFACWLLVYLYFAVQYKGWGKSRFLSSLSVSSPPLRLVLLPCSHPVCCHLIVPCARVYVCTLYYQLLSGVVLFVLECSTSEYASRGGGDGG